jgi:arsenate reductase
MSRPVVLFLCTGNSARSQMAEAFLRHYAGERFEVCSAGLEPRGVHPLAIRVMSEIGIDLSGHRSKPLSEFLGKISVRYAIIVCEQAERSCPRIWPFTLQRLFWPFEDPAAGRGPDEQKLKCFRAVRDRIEERIQRWLTEEYDLELPASA